MQNQVKTLNKTPGPEEGYTRSVDTTIVFVFLLNI